MGYPTIAAALVATLWLAACVAADPPATSMPEPQGPSSNEIKAAMNEIVDRADTVIVEERRYERWSPQRYVLDTSSGYDTRHMLVARLTGLTFAPPRGHDIFGARAEYQLVLSEEGLSLAAAAWDTTDTRRQTASAHLGFGMWMEHSFSLVRETLVLDPRRDEITVHPYIFSVGVASRTNPTALGGSATWSGLMLGVDEGFAGPDISRLERGERNVYYGDAEITLTSFMAPMVDVRFSNITNEFHNLADVVWRDLPVTAGGFQGRGILGRFYGPSHEEVGGVFQFDEINGAFGGARD